MLKSYQGHQADDCNESAVKSSAKKASQSDKISKSSQDYKSKTELPSYRREIK